MKTKAAMVGLMFMPGVGVGAVEGTLALEMSTDRVQITDAGGPVATYVWRDARILRPYWTRLHAPGGVQVTRNHPPVEGKDPTDHDTMHPGLWLAFGDVSGHDFWRNRAVIEHVRFLEPPAVRAEGVTFATENRLRATNGVEVCTQVSRFSLTRRPAGYLLIWEAAFRSDAADFFFGDQEELGLGVRMATWLSEKQGGGITSSTGVKTAKATWGNAYEWCDYSGTLADRRVGVMVMPDPANFRPSWFHNRDYGLMVANPFGRQAMRQGEASKVEVKRGETFRLSFGVLLHAASVGQPLDLAAAYADYLEQARRRMP